MSKPLTIAVSDTAREALARRRVEAGTGGLGYLAARDYLAILAERKARHEEEMARDAASAK